MDISATVAIITGGASGLGAATARKLHSMGASVALLDMDAGKGESVATELGDRALFVQTNVTSEEAVAAAIAKTVDAFGSINVCVNCAGVFADVRTASSENTDALDQFRRVMDINVNGTYNVARLAGLVMKNNDPNSEGERGVIVNTSSVAAFDGVKGQGAYAASKAAIAGLTLPLARDFSKLGIRVCSIAPGLFNAPMLGEAGAELDGLGTRVPFPRRLGHPEEYGALAASIIEQPYLNAETIRLDGAIRLG